VPSFCGKVGTLEKKRHREFKGGETVGIGKREGKTREKKSLSGSIQQRAQKGRKDFSFGLPRGKRKKENPE